MDQHYVKLMVNGTYYPLCGADHCMFDHFRQVLTSSFGDYDQMCRLSSRSTKMPLYSFITLIVLLVLSVSSLTALAILTVQYRKRKNGKKTASI